MDLRVYKSKGKRKKWVKKKNGALETDYFTLKTEILSFFFFPQGEKTVFDVNYGYYSYFKC